MSKYNRFFYLCSINSKQYEQAINQQLHIGAATNKVLSVISALRSNRCQAYAVSLPVLGLTSNIKSVKGVLLRENKNPVIFLPVVSKPILRRLLGSLYFAGFCWFTVKTHDRVLLYNYSPEYLPALLILKLKGNPAILDIEDAPHHKAIGLREIINKLTYKLSLTLCRNFYITVSTQVANNFNLKRYCVVYGAVGNIAPKTIHDTSEANLLRILYGGTLCNDTGLQLFCDTIELLSNTTNLDNKKIVFVVTGFGGEDKLNQLHSIITNKNIEIELKSNLSFDVYQSVFKTCQAALCLKIPNSEMGATTFPSKVVDITSAGLLLISTKVSDIPVLFNNDNALLLDEATPDKLCKALVWAIHNLEECKARSIRGQERAMELFSEYNVGKKIKEFIFQ